MREGPLPSTLRTFLFGADSVAALADSFVEVSNLGAIEARVAERLGGDSLGSFRDRLAHAAADFINLDPANLLADGLRKHRELVAVAEQTAKAGSSALVPLGTRRIALTQHPTVDVKYDGTTIGSVAFELEVAIDIAGLSAVVRNGTLEELEGERCELTAVFSLAPEELIAHGEVSFDANLALPSGGVRLV